MSGSNSLTITAHYDLSEATVGGAAHEHGKHPPIEILRHGPRPTCVVVNTDLAVPKENELSPELAAQDLEKRLKTITAAVLKTALPDTRKQS